MADARPVYPELDFPPAWPERPYTYLNMVATIDGKTVSGERDENVMDLGSSTDHATMRAIEDVSDAVMIGAGSLRATKGLHYAPGIKRFVVSSSGGLDYTARFFTDDPHGTWVVTGSRGLIHVPSPVKTLVTGESADWRPVLLAMRQDLGIERLLVEGGSELNASLFEADLIDEVFLTVAPKVKLGRETPTVAGGDPLPRGSLKTFHLLSCTVEEDEVFLRYRRPR
ncbi:MAG: dihydrofolate reductase family protein [Armatimonadetes bacterium]|nr:dihydrofolate reductase family protein [Armatimonadota bacterium]